jgi:transposase-like protein
MAPKRTKKPPAPPSPPPRRNGDEARLQALEQLGAGYSANAVAREFGVQARTVRRWRDSPEGQARIAEIRRERAPSFDETQKDLMTQGLELARLSLSRLGDLLYSRSGHVVRAAGTDLLDRFGPSRREHVHSTGDADDLDLTQASDEDLAALEAAEAVVEKLRKKKGAEG